MVDPSGATFPSYAELTKTTAWATTRPAGPIVGDGEAIGDAATRYSSGAQIGAGGMGTITLARDHRIGRDVAIKQLHAKRELSAEDQLRFLREARVQGQLEHPSIVPVYDIDLLPDGTTFFTMRRIFGKTLHEVVEQLRAGEPAALARFTQRELLTAFATVCLTIDYAHTRGVIHRDLKPANIMVGDFGEVYVLDWGVAILADEPVEQGVVGTRWHSLADVIAKLANAVATLRRRDREARQRDGKARQRGGKARQRDRKASLA